MVLASAFPDFFVVQVRTEKTTIFFQGGSIKTQAQASKTDRFVNK